MKTKKQYLSDLEIYDISVSKDEIKQQFRKLVVKYNTDQPGGEVYKEKYTTVLQAYKALNENNFAPEVPEIPKEEELTFGEAITRSTIELLRRGTYQLNLKKSDFNLIKLDNKIVFLDTSKMKSGKKHFFIDRKHLVEIIK